MNVMGYDVMEEENLPKFLKKKPQWVKCMVLTGTVFILTVAAISIGAIIGYTYCYLEYQSGLVKRNVRRHSTNIHIMHLPVQETNSTNRTINGALRSFLVSKIIQLCSVMVDEDGGQLAAKTYPTNATTL